METKRLDDWLLDNENFSQEQREDIVDFVASLSTPTERKAPKDWATWADFARCYDLVLFNECTQLVHRDNKSYDEGVINEWLESHYENCDAHHAQCRLENIDEDTEDEEEKKERQEIIDEWGDTPECNCKPYQWYAIAVSDFDAEWLNKHFNLDIFYSDTLGIYILPVYHYGTSWDYVPLSMNDSETE